MVIDMNEPRLNTVAQLRAFLEGTLEVQFCALNDDTQRYAFIHTLLLHLGCTHPIRCIQTCLGVLASVC
jgi:hypothetical protein